jgi:hypothetical protein
MESVRWHATSDNDRSSSIRSSSLEQFNSWVFFFIDIYIAPSRCWPGFRGLNAFGTCTSYDSERKHEHHLNSTLAEQVYQLINYLQHFNGNPRNIVFEHNTSIPHARPTLQISNCRELRVDRRIPQEIEG